VDLPTYTNIWRIEKRLYKLYDFRLPMPLPISWIAVFCGITIPYVVVLAAIGVPFNHNLVWLYVLPPGVLTWLTTRPVLENKRLHELLVSQLRYIGEPRTWCRLVPLSEKNEIRVYARVWHRAPAYAEGAQVLTVPAGRPARESVLAGAPALHLGSGTAGRPGAGRDAGPARRTWPARPGRPGQAPKPVQAGPPAPAGPPEHAGPPAWPHAGMAPARASEGARGLSVPVRAGSERAGARRAGPGRAAPAARAGAGRTAPGWTGSGAAGPAGAAGSPGTVRPAAARPGSGAITPAPRPAIPGQVLRGPSAADPAPGGPPPIAPPPIEVAHETQGPQGPAAVPLWGRASSRPAPGGSGPRPAPGASSAPGGQAGGAVTGARAPRALPPAGSGQPGTGAGRTGAASGRPGSTDAASPGTGAPPATTQDASPPAPSIERALSGPDRIDSWQRRVRVVPGGQGPGKRDQETLNRDRARLPLTGPRRIVFLGCTSGAGQTVTALMTGHLLATLRGVPVAAIDLNPGRGSLARQAQTAPVLTVAELLAGSAPAGPADAATGARLDVISAGADPASPPAPGERDYARLADHSGRHYPLVVLDPGAAAVTRVLGIADQLVLVAPASADAPRSLAMTQEWLNSNGHGELAARAVTVVNGVSRASLSDVEQAEAVARGRCRAIVRIPWDDVLAAGGAGRAGPAGVPALRPQARHAYTALAGVLVAGLAAAPVPRKVLH